MAEIEKRNEFKTMFQVGKISCSLLHDLISPITSLSLYSENIKDAQLKESINPIIKSTEDIKAFISLIQDAVEQPDKYSVVNLYETIRHALDLGKHKIITNGVVLQFDFKAPRSTSIYCKKLEIYQIVMNLVGNAVDAFIVRSNNYDNSSRQKIKKINLIVSKGSKNIYIKVKDNGCGIRASVAPKIFDKSFTTKENGMGIGLYTVKQIIEKDLGGEISFTSQTGANSDRSIQKNRGSGTEFRIKIPIENQVSF